MKSGLNNLHRKTYLFCANDIAAEYLKSGNPVPEAILDNDFTKCGGKLEAIPILYPYPILTKDSACNFIICSKNHVASIKNTLISFGVDIEDILIFCSLTKVIRPYSSFERYSNSVLVSTLPKAGTMWWKEVLWEGTFSSEIDVSHSSWKGDVNNTIGGQKLADLADKGGFYVGHIFPNSDNLKLINLYSNRFILHLRDPRQAFLSYFYFFERLQHKTLLQKENALTFHCLPEDYFSFSRSKKQSLLFDDFYLSAIQFIKQWVDILNKNKLKVPFIVTTHESMSLSTDFSDRIRRFLGCTYTLPFDAQPIKGKNNFRLGQTNRWKNQLSPELIEKMNACFDDDIKQVLYIDEQ